MFTDRAANRRLHRQDLPARLLDDADVLHLTGYTFFEPPLLEVALWLLGQARSRGLAVTIDPGSAAFLARLEPAAFLRWTDGAAVCFPNRDEAAILVGEADPDTMATRLTRHYGVVALKLGGAAELTRETRGQLAERALEGGVLAGYPMSDLKVTLYDGSYHDVDSSEIAFKIAGSMALKAAAKRAKPVLLEPIMAVEVVVPEEYMGDVIGDLNSRRGRIEGMELRGTTQIIKSMVPLSEMFGYATELRSRTQGRGSFTMHFGRYEDVPSAIAEEIVNRVQGKVTK